jgi:hypothetical protein
MLKRKQLTAAMVIAACVLALAAASAFAGASATVKPHRGPLRSKFEITLSGFKPRERIRAVESETYAGRLGRAYARVNSNGVLVMTVRGHDPTGRHTWRFTGLRSHRHASVSYRVTRRTGSNSA